MRTVVYTDGSCYPNPAGNGGWSFVVRDDNGLRVHYGYSAYATNNRMEMMAILNAMEEINVIDNAIIYSDSEYCVNGFNRWMFGWVKKRWKDVKNDDLWRNLYDERKNKPNIELRWVRGHDDNELNEIADKWANKARIEKLEGSTILKSSYQSVKKHFTNQ